MLEIALGQEQAAAAEAILERAEHREFSLVIPWISLAEPFSTVEKRSRDRQQFIRELNRRLSDMRRSQRLEHEVQSIELAPTLFSRIDGDETDYLFQAAKRVLRVATVLPANATRFQQAIDYRARYAFSPKDALVYASVVGDLMDNESPGQRFFVTKDQDDFGLPGIVEELRALGCELVLSFSEMALLLEQPPPE